MTTNHHTPISIGDPANASTFNAPLGQLDSAIGTALNDASTALTDINNLKSGAGGFTQLNLSTTSTLTISSGLITATRTRHLVDTEASASWDDLDTINGGVAGDVLVLQSVTSARVVVVKHNTGNIFLNGFDVVLDNPNKALTLLHDGTQWTLIGNPPRQINRISTEVLFNGGQARTGTHYPPNADGTASDSMEAEGLYVQYVSSASINAYAGVYGLLAFIVQMRHNPSFTVWLKTGANVSNIRWYIGLASAAGSFIYGGGDNLPSASRYGVLFRYSTVAGDIGFRPVTSDATTQTVGTAMTTVTANTAYKLSISIQNGAAYFAVNDGVPFRTTLTLPSSTSSLTWVTHLQTQDAVAKTNKLKRILIEMD